LWLEHDGEGNRIFRIDPCPVQLDSDSSGNPDSQRLRHLRGEAFVDRTQKIGVLRQNKPRPNFGKTPPLRGDRKSGGLGHGQKKRAWFFGAFCKQIIEKLIRLGTRVRILERAGAEARPSGLRP
jgi:hypothetical protein